MTIIREMSFFREEAHEYAGQLEKRLPRKKTSRQEASIVDYNENQQLSRDYVCSRKPLVGVALTTPD
jgi:hypothetical protein